MGLESQNTSNGVRPGVRATSSRPSLPLAMLADGGVVEWPDWPKKYLVVVFVLVSTDKI